MHRRMRRHQQLMATLEHNTPGGPWGPSDEAVQAGRRDFAGRVTAGPAQGIDVLVTAWASRPRPWRPFKKHWTPGEPIPQDAYDFCIDLFTHDTEADARYEAAVGNGPTWASICRKFWNGRSPIPSTGLPRPGPSKLPKTGSTASTNPSSLKRESCPRDPFQRQSAGPAMPQETFL